MNQQWRSRQWGRGEQKKQGHQTQPSASGCDLDSPSQACLFLFLPAQPLHPQLGKCEDRSMVGDILLTKPAMHIISRKAWCYDFIREGLVFSFQLHFYFTWNLLYSFVIDMGFILCPTTNNIPHDDPNVFTPSVAAAYHIILYVSTHWPVSRVKW